MAKAYWIGHVQVHDAESYKKYIEGAAPAYREFGARFIVRGGREDRVEAGDLGSRHVVIEFDSLEKAQACYNSETYQNARKHRLGASTGRLVIVEGAE